MDIAPIDKDPVLNYMIMQQAKRNLGALNKTQRKARRGKRLSYNDTLKEKHKEQQERLKTVSKIDENVVFSYASMSNVFSNTMLLDKLISMVVNKLKDNGILDLMKSKNDNIIHEERSMYFANCYKFISYVTKNLKEQDDMLRVKLDSRYAQVYDEVIKDRKFYRYEFKVIHRPISDEPMILEVMFK